MGGNSDASAWEEVLRDFLRDARRVLVLGVGNEIRGDDGAGSYVASLINQGEFIRSIVGGNPRGDVQLLGIPGGSAPENFVSPAVKFSPSHLLVVDAFQGGFSPGYISPLPREFLGGVSLSSHRMPLKVILDFLTNEGIQRILVMGIQARSVALGESMSKEVRDSARMLAASIVRFTVDQGHRETRPVSGMSGD